jgi:t-SNARE complex subunit (syntaxin)
LLSIKNKSIIKNEQEISQQMNKIIDDINQTRIRIGKIIKNLKQKLDYSKEEKDNDFRIKKNLFDAFIKKYQSTVNRFQKIESDIKNDKQTKLIREAEIAINHELNEEERKNLIKNPDILVEIYENKLRGKAPVRLKNAVRNLEERHKDILKLERSINELHKMVDELNILVLYQGGMIDNIAENVNIAKDYVIKGEATIGKSKDCIIY